MPKQRPKSGKERKQKGIPRAESSPSPEAAVCIALRLAVPGPHDDAIHVRLQLAAEYVVEAFRGSGVEVSTRFEGFSLHDMAGVNCLPLEELLAESLESVELGTSKEQRVRASEALLESGALRLPQCQHTLSGDLTRLRLEVDVLAEEESEANALFAIRVGLAGMALLTLDDDWHHVTVADIFDGDRLAVEIGAGQPGAGGRYEVAASAFRAEWEIEDADDEVSTCGLCDRQMPLTYHHLIPKEEAHRYRDKLSREELTRGVQVCRPCHSAIHRTYTNAQLAAQHRTIESLLDETDPSTLPLRRWVQYAARQRVSRTAEEQRNSTRRGGAGLQYGRRA
jgi:hypothetical protein